jgi:hypothetical protein
MKLKIFNKTQTVGSLAELRSLLETRHNGKYGAFWLSKATNGLPALGMFINADRACMFFFRFEGDSGFHTLGENPDDFDHTEDFVIDNFQLDQYPRAMVVRTSDALRAFEEFFTTADLPASVRWLELM